MAVPALAQQWPGAAPCHTTLQACINGVAAGSVIEIASPAPIDEAIVLDKSLTLRPAPGVKPRFASGRGITGTFTGSGASVVRLQGLALRNAMVRLDRLGSGSADFVLERLTIEGGTSAQPSGIRIDLLGGIGSPRRVVVRENRLQLDAAFGSAIDVRALDQPASVEFAWNVVETRESSGNGISAGVAHGAHLDVVAYGNEVRGPFRQGGIFLAEYPVGGTPATMDAQLVSNVVVGSRARLGSGIYVAVNQGSIEAQIINNTLVSGEFGIALTRWEDPLGAPVTGTTSGRIVNNLVAYNRVAIQNSPLYGGTALNDYNLVFSPFGTPGVHTPGANDVTSNPILRATQAPRLQSGSPARDAGNGFALLFAPQVPLLDGDGLRRLVGTAVDIGAYEFGHRSLSVRKTTTEAVPYTAVADAQVDADRNARLFPTGNFHIGGVDAPHPLRVFDFFDQWWIGTANDQNMPQGAGFNLFVPRGNSSTGVLVHSASGSNTLDDASLVDWSQTNGQPDRFILFSQSTAFGSPANPHPLALDYIGARWHLRTTNSATFPTSTRYNLYAQPRSPNAFVHTVASAAVQSALDHPLLNGTPCARVHASPIAQGTSNGTVFDVEYVTSSGRWRLFSHIGLFAAGQRFNVLVVPEQVEDCSKGRLFSDGFE